MKIYLTSAYDTHTGLDLLVKNAALDVIGEHSVCLNPDEADAIVFIENTHFDDVLFKRLMEHPLVSEQSHKVYMYNEMDRPWDVLPGLYCCMPRKQFNTNRHKAFTYLATTNQYISTLYEQQMETKWLYSFVGSMSHSSRHRVMRLKSDSGYLEDTSEFNVWDASPEERASRGREYADVLGASQYVLCPRGIGTSSIRLYEALEAGRVPVIMSDHWVAPEETDWSFAIQVEERRISSIPGLLKSIAHEAEDRGSAAREVWEESYSPSTIFNTFAESIASLVDGDAHSRRANPRNSFHKWFKTGELLTRTAAQRLRGQ